MWVANHFKKKFKTQLDTFLNKAQLLGPVPRRQKGQRPQQVEQHVVNSENQCFS
jgi:hypothetical protein